jgi:transcriptional regulator with PAS, ATPase and Fis domain
VRDVAERQRTEETRARLAAIVESSHDAIIGKSLDGTITNWNKGAELLFGFAAAEIIGKSSSIFIPRDRLEEEMHLLARWQRDQTVTRYRSSINSAIPRPLACSIRGNALPVVLHEKIESGEAEAAELVEEAPRHIGHVREQGVATGRMRQNPGLRH